MKPSRSFASDNNAGVHPEVLKAISAVNQGHVVGYGDDPYTESAGRLFKRVFGNDIEVFFVFNGTAANCLSLKALTNSYHAVICAEAAHIYVDECGAPEKFTRLQAGPYPRAKRKTDGGSRALRLSRNRGRAPRSAPRRLNHPVHRSRHCI